MRNVMMFGLALVLSACTSSDVPNKEQVDGLSRRLFNLERRVKTLESKAAKKPPARSKAPTKGKAKTPPKGKAKAGPGGKAKAGGAAKAKAGGAAKAKAGGAAKAKAGGAAKAKADGGEAPQ